MLNRPYLREALIALAALSTGWWAHSTRPVQAAGPATLSYQFSGAGPATVLSLYNPGDSTIYVYQGITTGYSKVQCSYRLHLGYLGTAIERENCPIYTLNR